MRTEWPFKTMKEGEVVIVRGHPPGRVSTTVHTTGRYKGWKFTTKTGTDEQGPYVAVQRLRLDGAGAPAEPSARGEVFEYEALEVGESVEYEGAERVTAVLNSIQGRERKLGRKFKRQTRTDLSTGLYAALRVTRTA